MPITRIDDHLPGLLPFVRGLADAYHTDDAASAVDEWGKMAARVTDFFTPERMAAVERVVPGWGEMAAQQHGLTLVHEMCALTSLITLPEYRELTPDQATLAQWILLFHDVAKKPQGKRDHVHPFRSAAITGRALAALGFPVYGDEQQIGAWAKLTHDATKQNVHGEDIPDNAFLPQITDGIRALFGWDTSTGLIVRGVLFHQIIDNIDEFPQANALTPDEARRYINAPLFPLLRVMMLADCDAWALFDLDKKARWREETLNVFANLSRMIAPLP